MRGDQSTLPLVSPEEMNDQVTSTSREYNYRTLEYPVEVLVLKYQTGQISIPEYQRDLVWTDKQKRYFIESVLLQIPVSPMFGALNARSEIDIVDGSQRLRCLRAFLEGKFVLRDLEKLNSLNGLKFSDLPREVQLTLLSRDIRLILLTDSQNLDVQFEIFRRINSTPTRLNDSEIRRGAFPGPFWKLVEECADYEGFVELTPMGDAKRSRFEREELVLRFFAYADKYRSFVHDVNKFLDEYLKEMNVASDADPDMLPRYRDRFITTIDFIRMHIPNSFQRKGRKQTPRTRFEAVSVGTLLALESGRNLNLQDLNWLESDEFEEITRTEAANSRPRLTQRIEYVKQMLEG